MTRAFLLVAAALGLFAGAAARAGADSVGALQVAGTFIKQFGPIDCAAGTASTTICFGDSILRGDTIAGLGTVTVAPYTLFWENFGSPCGHVHAQISDSRRR